MIELLGRTDPAQGLEIDAARLRAKVDERIGISIPLASVPSRARRSWLVAAAAFALVVAVLAPLYLLQRSEDADPLVGEGFRDLPGVEAVIPLYGLRWMAVDGDSIWVASPFARELYRIHAATGTIEATYPTEDAVGPIVVGGGYLWLMSEAGGGEVLRFDPVAGAVDLAIPIGTWPTAQWMGDHLWVSTGEGELLQITPDGEIRSVGRGELKGVGPEGLWILDPETGDLTSIAPDGQPRDVAIAGEGVPVQQVLEHDGYLWVIDQDWSIYRYDLHGEEPVWAATAGLKPNTMVEYDGSIWVTSFQDHVLTRFDAASTELLSVTPLGGRPGALVAVDGSLWVALNHPGVLLRLDPDADLMDMGSVIVDEVIDGFRLFCTGAGDGPTVILDGYSWIDHGSWSVIQAELAAEARVCAHGYFDGERLPAEKARNLGAALQAHGVDGPYVLVAAGDGVHSMRLFAETRADVAGVVLVEPVPIGFQDFTDGVLGPEGHPPWLDIDQDLADSLGDFGQVPLVVIGQDPEAVWLSTPFRDSMGEEIANQMNDFWQEGLAYYAGLSADSRTLVVPGTGLDRVIWDRRDIVVREVIDMLGRIDGQR